MASGRIELTSGKAWSGYIAWTSTQNAGSNSSTVTARLYTRKTDGYATSGGSLFEGYLSIGEESVSVSYEQEETGYTLRGILTAEVPHGSNGAGSVTISASITKSYLTTLQGATLTGSGTADLGTIAQASTISANKQTVQMGTPLILTISRHSTSYTHKLYYWDGVAVKNVLFASNVGTSYTWTLPDLAAIVPGATSGNLWIRCETYSGTTMVGAVSIQLTMTVQDPTTPAVAESSAVMGTGKTISCRRNSANFTVRLSFSMGGVTQNIAEGKADSFQWTPDYAFAAAIPTQTSGTGTLTCITYNGSAEVGRRTATIRLTVPENDVTRPSFASDGLALSVITDLTGDLASLYIRGLTGLMASFTASSVYSEIRNYTISAGSTSASGNPAVIERLIDAETVRVVATVTDARGFSATVTKTIYVVPYQKPRIIPYSGYSEVICERAKSTGELSADGTYLAIRAGRSFSSFVLNGAERNTCRLRFRHRVSGGGYSEWSELIGSGDARTEVSMLISGIVVLASTSYDVELEAIDALGGRHSLTFSIMTERMSFVLYDGPDGAAFGKFPEEPGVVDIAAHMKLLVRGKLVVSGGRWETLSLASGVTGSGAGIGRTEDCCYRVSEGFHIYIAFNCAFAFSGSPVAINAEAIPAEYRPAREVRAVCAANGGRTAAVCVDTNGYIRVETVSGSGAVSWIDGYLDYWI